MRIRVWFWRILLAMTVCLVVLVVLGTVTGHPLFLGYVETASMDPTISPGDGFIALSPIVTAPPSQGDIVVFESQTEEVELIAHRIVGRTEEGFITQGDNNSFTDQDRGEPPVQEAQIAGQPLTIGGTLVTIPEYGVFTVTVQSWLQSAVFLLGLGRYPGATVALAVLILGVGAIFAGSMLELLSTEGRKATRAPRRQTIDTRLLFTVVLLLVALPVTTFMTLPAETTELTILSASSASGPGVFEPGEERTTSFSVENTQFVPKVIILESQGTGVAVSKSVLTVAHGEEASTNLTVTAPPTEGRYVRIYGQYHYPQLLPADMIYRLHRVSPAAAIGVLTGLIVGPIAALFWLLVGFRKVPLRAASR